MIFDTIPQINDRLEEIKEAMERHESALNSKTQYVDLLSGMILRSLKGEKRFLERKLQRMEDEENRIRKIKKLLDENSN